MTSIVDLAVRQSLQIASLTTKQSGFRYGRHEIPLGQPKAYRVDPFSHTVFLYSLGGMGLEPCKNHTVIFEFPTDTTEKADRIAKQLLEYTGPLNQGCITAIRPNLFPNSMEYSVTIAYQVTPEKLLKGLDIGFDREECNLIPGVITVSEKYGFTIDLSETWKIKSADSMKVLEAAEKRVDAILERRPELTARFFPYSQRLSQLFSSEKPLTAVEAEILDNTLSIPDFNTSSVQESWRQVHQFLMPRKKEDEPSILDDEILQSVNELPAPTALSFHENARS